MVQHRSAVWMATSPSRATAVERSLRSAQHLHAVDIVAASDA